MKKKTLVIEIEIFRREIDHKMYLGLKAALKNFRVIIGSREHLFWLIKNEQVKSPFELIQILFDLPLPVVWRSVKSARLDLFGLSVRLRCLILSFVFFNDLKK